MIQPQGGLLAKHTTMPPRKQKTPHGVITLTSKWVHGRYYLVANGLEQAIKWLFPRKTVVLERHGAIFRYTFKPDIHPVTVERELRKTCAKWEAAWNKRLQDEITLAPEGANTTQVPSTLRQAYEHHQRHYAPLLGDRTSEQYPVRMAEWFRYVGADTPLEEITAEKILSVRSAMKEELNSSNSTINAKVATLKKILNMAHRKGWIIRPSWRDVPNLRVIRKPTRYWTNEQAAIAFKVAKNDEQSQSALLMLTLGLHLGLRKNEAVHLRWMDLILDRVHPVKGKPSPIAVIQQRPGFTTKTYENRKVPLSSEAVHLLTANRPRDAKPTDYILAPARLCQKRGGTKRVYRYDCVKLWCRVRNQVIAQGGAYIEFKELRHSYACNCLQNGHSVEKVARWLGHKDPRMVRQHYAHLLDYDDDTELKFLD
jgi:integrase